MLVKLVSIYGSEIKEAQEKCSRNTKPHSDDGKQQGLTECEMMSWWNITETIGVMDASLMNASVVDGVKKLGRGDYIGMDIYDDERGVSRCKDDAGPPGGG